MEKPHKRLDAWKLSMDRVIEIYNETDKFPNHERYGLIDQIRRAAISIPSNIAEGAARHTRKEFMNYLHIAQASLSELDTQVELATRLSYIDENRRGIVNARMDRIDKTIRTNPSLSKKMKRAVRHPLPLTPYPLRGYSERN
jgi:four helix bundle protein